MKKFVCILLGIMMIVATTTAASALEVYTPSKWAKKASNDLELTWFEDTTRNATKGEFMFAFLRTIQASKHRNDVELLESDTDLDFYDADELSYSEQDEASILVDLGVLNGYNGYMNLSSDIKRSEAAKVLKFFNSELDLPLIRKGIYFADCEDHWAETSIVYAYRIGLVNGCGKNDDGDDIFSPDANLTIEELVQILYNISEVNDDFSYEDIAKALTETFEVETDLDISEYDYDKDELSTDSVVYLNIGDAVTYSTNSTGVWTSSNRSVASVSDSGKITANSQGRALISRGNVAITVYVGESTKYIEVGETKTISKYNSSSWRSSNKKIATVDRYANVKGISEGKVTISRGDEESYEVTVTKDTIINLKVDGSENLGYSGSKWVSSNKDIATVSSTGVIRAISSGEATISNRHAKYLVIVSPESSLRLNIGDSVSFATSSGWKTSNKRVISVSGNTIKALSKGVATVSNDEETITVTVGYVSNAYYDDITINVGQTYTLGKGYANWVSSNSNIASVSRYGKVTAKRAGSVVITNEDTDDEYYITVTEADDFDETYVTIKVGESLILDGDYGNWTSSNSSIVSVSSSGKIKGIKAGSATIKNKATGETYYVLVEDSGDNDNDSDYSDTVVYVEGYEPSSYYNAFVDDTMKIIVESANGRLSDVTLSNSKCELIKDISSLGDGKYTFTVTSKSAGACVLTLEFADDSEVEFTINSFN